MSNRKSHRGNIELDEGNKLLQHDSEVVKELNNFFKDAVPFLYINENSNIINPDSINITDHIEKGMSKYKFHPSNLIVNDKIVNQEKFSFKPTSKLDIGKEIQQSNPKKATTSDIIPPKI